MSTEHRYDPGPMMQSKQRRLLLKGGYLIRLDDIAPNMNWDGYFRLKRLFDEFGVHPLLGVIPDNRDPELTTLPQCQTDFWDEIREVQSRGWEIAMHGYQHVYDSSGIDFLGVRTRSEFAGHPLEIQLQRLKKARSIFDREKVKVNVFFAPSHTFDENTIHALKEIGITSVSDGFGLFPFNDHGILFIPQLVGRAVRFPFGIYTSCHHLNYFRESDFLMLERFVRRNHARILTYSQATEFVKNSPWNRSSGAILKRALQTKRRVGRVLDGYRQRKLYGSAR
jgi:predicted deacetylase